MNPLMKEPTRLVMLHDVGKLKPRVLLVNLFSKREIRSWQQRCRAAMELVDDAARDEEYDRLIAEVIVGWENIDAPFTVAGISEAYTLPEYLALFTLVPMVVAAPVAASGSPSP